MDAVTGSRRLFGVPDHLMHVAVADAAAYEAFSMNELAELPGIGRVTSAFTMNLVTARPMTAASGGASGTRAPASPGTRGRSIPSACRRRAAQR